MQIIGSNLLPDYFVSLFKWSDLEEGSPTEQTRNRWLHMFGGFAKYRHPDTNATIWFPAQVVAWDIQERPSVIGAIRTSGNDTYNQIVQNMLPTFIDVNECEAFYYCLPLGLSIQQYIHSYIMDVEKAREIKHQAVERSLQTQIFLSPRRWAKHFKRALNSLLKGEMYVLEGNPTEMDGCKVLEIPSTADKLSVLWDSYDWAKQDAYALLGIAFSPEKRERMINAEIIAQNQIVRMHREFISSQIKVCAEEAGLGEKVQHMVEWVLEEERNLIASTTSLSLSGTDTKIEGPGQEDSINTENI